ncbi:MAG: DNA-processing protein DprA, partial [Duodenibacillus sp.]|nr:DNA-processing protein DprA [Duodenibacillus sp.]
MLANADDRRAWLRLACSPGLAWPAAAALLAAFGLPRAALEAPARALAAAAGEEAARAVASSGGELRFRRLEAWLARTPQSAALTPLDEAYPRELLNAADAPLVMALRGDARLLARPRIAVTGCDSPDKEGEANAAQFSEALARQGLAVVTALASDAERCAARGALAGGGLLLVAAAGPERACPAADRPWYAAAAGRGLVASFALPGEPPLEAAERDRLALAMSRGLLVVQSEAAGRSLRLARAMAELGRDVMAIPGSIHSPLYKGNHRLLRQGAALVE